MLRMSKVELYAAIRRDHRDGMSMRELERKHGVTWRTMQELDSSWPEPRKKLPPRATGLDRYKPVIDEILRADLDAPRKHTTPSSVNYASTATNSPSTVSSSPSTTPTRTATDTAAPHRALGHRVGRHSTRQAGRHPAPEGTLTNTHASSTAAPSGRADSRCFRPGEPPIRQCNRVICSSRRIRRSERSCRRRRGTPTSRARPRLLPAGRCRAVPASAGLPAGRRRQVRRSRRRSSTVRC